MDTEKSDKVVDVVETPPQEQTTMEKEAPEVSTEPEKPQAVDEEPKQLALNDHDKEVVNVKETEELIVTENAALTVKKTNMETEDSSPKEKSETESVSGAVAPPEPDESSEKISHPVSQNTDTEPKNILPEQQPASKNDPEPLPMKTHLADSASETKPEKQAESVPQAEIQEQTLPKPTTPQQSVDTQPPSQEVSGQAQSQAELQATMESGAEQDAKEETKNNVADESPKEGGEEKPVDTKKVAVVLSESEQNDAEPKKEEDTVPAPGSLSFPLLEKKQTKDALGTSRVLVVLRGLPGSGKSFLARAIAGAYKDNCTVICADDHGVKPEDQESSVEGYKALDEAIVACCSAGTASPVLIVVDDTNHTQNRLVQLEEIAKEHSLVAIFLEPQTEWRGDPAELTKKTRRGLDEAQLEVMKVQFEEMSVPFYFGWFLLSSVQEKIKCTSMDFVKTLDTLEAFKKHMSDFTGKAEKEVDLEQYFEAKGPLHCTTKFCDYGKAEGAKEYALQPAVKDFYGSTTELSLTALFVTPRTVGARVSLTEEQLLLWPADAEKETESVVPAAASLPLGSRAHITLGCAEGVQAVQTGLDLLEILALQKEGQQGELVEEMELGSLTYYGDGRWFFSLREPICASACFSSYYKCKKVEPTKKEPEKKKKPKCTIL